MAEEKRIKRIWTAAIASFAEAMRSLEGEDALEFPLIAVPFGTERHDGESRLFLTADDMTEEAIEELLANAFPSLGVRRVHLISVKSPGTSAWGTLLTDTAFKTDEN
ncbi:MAG: hypothetical protein JWL82_387 [Parcubacteria group bacterium]|nr:hypothetical protein [Parcubacteria group bacterium]